MRPTATEYRRSSVVSRLSVWWARPCVLQKRMKDRVVVQIVGSCGLCIKMSMEEDALLRRTLS